MLPLEDLKAGLRVDGVVPGQLVTVIAAQMHGPDVVELTYKTADGDLGQRVLGRDAEAAIAVGDAPGVRSTRPRRTSGWWPRPADQARRPVGPDARGDDDATSSRSRIRSAPSTASCCPARPLRFLLADDPGAGKTIMAGLYIKELVLRDDVRRCLIVAPGGLVEQWQDELCLKFGLRFEIFTHPAGRRPRSVARCSTSIRC